MNKASTREIIEACRFIGEHWTGDDKECALVYEAAGLLDKCRAAGFITDDGEVRKVNGRLTYDAEGNIVAHGGKVWVMGYTPEAHECFTVVMSEDYEGRADSEPYVSWGGPSYGSEPITLCHSTREAAEAARDTFSGKARAAWEAERGKA